MKEKSFRRPPKSVDKVILSLVKLCCVVLGDVLTSRELGMAFCSLERISESFYRGLNF